MSFDRLRTGGYAATPFDKLRVTRLDRAVFGPLDQLCRWSRVSGAEDLA
jgi:hypothetical protein